MSLLNTPRALYRSSFLPVEKRPYSSTMDSLPSKNVRERELRRYGAYFKGWCQAFGEHESIVTNENEDRWLIGENQVGMILTNPLLRQLNRETLLQGNSPTLIFDRQGAQIGLFFFPFESKSEKQVLGTIGQLFETGTVLHLFRTSHFLYGNGRNIITVSSKRPTPIIYRETGTMKIEIQ